ncbi:hypothetical protein CDCA_CDCA11G3108 [Cyanidium caldarium]|uniref:Peptidase M16C associated domain-containing protein n=1 Tax=Cyanidium caldarium TaxID=2771 RepID=A0AAV9IY94_CYACA|nr:hypothetical protein CDCA_CDCA11G3108 [Cyanidium caldarium]
MTAVSAFELVHDTWTGSPGRKIPVRKYRSRSTGLTVVVASVPGPLVSGYLTLSTEARDHAGIPHCLEHLVFMGSERYPYKGFLDAVANRCVAQGTNAWTDTDHTAYTVTTAGARGFLQLLPIYLDHVLFPTLTDAAFDTEVHHLVGTSCTDAGVVYCEMEARENTADSRALLRCLRHLYGEAAACGYAAETGGMLHELRQLTNARVRQYHRAYYRAENLCVVVCGLVEAEALFAALEPVEAEVCARELSTRARPWSDAVPGPPSAQPIVERIVFPAEGAADGQPSEADGEEEETGEGAADSEGDNGETGLVLLGWRGPPIDDVLMRTAIQVMDDYLSESETSPLQAALVEREDAFSNSVTFTTLEHAVTANLLHVENVPLHRLDQVYAEAMRVLQAVYEGGVDVRGRLRVLIRRRLRQFYAAMEDDAHETIAGMVTTDFLYGDGAHLERELNVPQTLQVLLTRDESFWRERVLRRWFLDGNTAGACCVVCEPSRAEAERLRAEEAHRVAQRNSAWSAAEREALTARLRQAVAQNEQAPPEALVRAVPVPDDFDTLPRFRVHTHYLDDTASGVRLQLEDVESEFVRLTAVLDTRDLSARHRLLLPLLLETLFSTGIAERDYVQVVDALLRDTVDYGCSLGVGSAGGGGSAGFSAAPFAQSCCVALKLVREQYACGVQWLSAVLHRVRFEAERVRVAAHKLLNDVSPFKRDGAALASAVDHELVYDGYARCNLLAASPIRQRRFLLRVLRGMAERAAREKGVKEPADDIVSLLEELEVLRRTLTRPGNVFLHAIVSVRGELEEALRPWRKCFGVAGGCVSTGNGPLPAPNSLVQLGRELRRPLPSVATARLVAVDAVESAFASLTVATEVSFSSPDYPPLLVLHELLTALEGPLWRQIRGHGLAYGFALQCSPESGTSCFTLYRSSALVAALQASLRLFREWYAHPAAVIRPMEVEAARAGVIYALVAREGDVESAALQRLYNSCRGVTHDYGRELVRRVSAVQPEALVELAPRALAHLAQPTECVLSVALNPAKVSEAVTGARECGWGDVQAVSSVDDLFPLDGEK